MAAQEDTCIGISSIIVEELLPYILDKMEELEKTTNNIQKLQAELSRNLKFINCDIGVLESTVRSVSMNREG